MTLKDEVLKHFTPKKHPHGKKAQAKPDVPVQPDKVSPKIPKEKKPKLKEDVKEKSKEKTPKLPAADKETLGKRKEDIEKSGVSPKVKEKLTSGRYVSHSELSPREKRLMRNLKVANTVLRSLSKIGEFMWSINPFMSSQSKQDLLGRLAPK